MLWVAIAEKPYTSINIDIRYDYNCNTAYFDGIQLYKEEFGNSYTYDGKGNVTKVVDLQKQTTTYEYDTNSNLTKILQDNKAKVTYTYDSYHNVKTATTNKGVVYNFEYDTYGNNTKVSIGSGSQKISSSATYSSDGNRLVSTTDALAKMTTYGYNEDTGVLDWVQYPEDTEATRTEYTYDSMYRMATAECTTDSNLNLSAGYTYTNDYLTSIQTPSTTYSFGYGDFGLRESVKVGAQALVTYQYTNDANRYLQSLDYSNGDSVRYTYDKKGRLLNQRYFDEGIVTDIVSYTYDNNGALATVTDSATGRTTTYYYDLTDRMIKYVEKGTDFSHSVGYEYDTKNNLTQQVEEINGTKHTTSYTYDDDNRVTSSGNDTTSVDYYYDSFGRLGQRMPRYQGNAIIYDKYRYANGGTETTSGLVASVENKYGDTITIYSYAYDDNGNITSISDGTNTTTYLYDSANQLIRENNQAGGFTRIWEYDNAGNILNRKEYAYTTESLDGVTPADTVAYAYDNSQWGDLLTAYGGSIITYDTVGNPLTNGEWDFTWEHGRQLSAMSKTGETWSYSYNADGMRTGRSDGTRTYSYIYNGSQLSRMTVDSHTLDFTYDAKGTPVTAIWNGTIYYYVTNLQGDVLMIIDTDRNPVVRYTYDAWGNILSISGAMASTLGTLNPLRYRGYVYDQETGLYYVSSRYYDPEIGRFINADDIDLLGANGDFASLNLFAYCGNNPVSRADSNGQFWNVVIGAVVGGVVSGAIAAATSYAKTGKVDWGSVAINIAVGAVGGAVAATGLGALAQAGLTAATSGVGNFAEQCYTKGIDNVNYMDVAGSALVGGVTSLVGTGAGKLAAGKIESAGTALLNKGKDKLLTGVVRKSVGQSHSQLLKQGTKYAAQGLKKINIFRGTSSVIGSGIGVFTSIGYNSYKTSYLGW